MTTTPSFEPAIVRGVSHDDATHGGGINVTTYLYADVSLLVCIDWPTVHSIYC